MKEIKIDERKELLLEILDYIDNICNENNLSYFLAYGTLIGAIRHKGFIPWDDDVDIYMPLDDYKKVVKIINNSSNLFRFLDCRDNSNYPLSYGKIVRTDTITYEDSYSFRDVELGIHVDVFPLIKVDDKKLSKNKKKIAKLCKFYRMKCLYPIKGDGIIKNITKFTLHTLSFYRKFNDNALKICEFKEQCLGDDYYVELGEYSNYKHPNNDFNGYELCEFEGRNFRVPIGYDNILKSIYNNYMEIPSEKDRQSTHRCRSYYK